MDWADIEQQIDTISVVGRQCVAVTCLERYCRFHSISHPDISRFIDHVWRVTQVHPETWIAWEEGFSKMPITGLGDPLPPAVLAAVPQDIREEFARLINFVLETSAVTWWGGNLEGTKAMLLRVLLIVSEYDIALPEIKRYANPPVTDHGGWGEELSDAEVAEWRSWS